MRRPNLHNIVQRLRDRDQRGAALVEFAIAIPILIALLAIVFDVGIGYSAARSSSSAARSAARVGALAGDQRMADFRALDALRAQFGDGSNVTAIYIYRSPVTNLDGLPPESKGDCEANPGCNYYEGSILDGLSQTMFTTDTSGAVDTCGAGSPDENWCPLGRRADEDDYLGVLVQSTSSPTIGAISPDSFTITDRAVFALYFPPASAATPAN